MRAQEQETEAREETVWRSTFTYAIRNPSIFIADAFDSMNIPFEIAAGKSPGEAIMRNNRLRGIGVVVMAVAVGILFWRW